MKKIIYATTNKYKLDMANMALTGSSYRLEKAPQELPDVPEIQSDSQEEVAIDKAMKYYDLLKCPVVVMDSGLFIKNLNGFPGVYTKYAIETIGADGLIALAKTLTNTAAFTKRTVAYCDGESVKTFSSQCHGTIILEQRGENGRDYDKIFLVKNREKTLAELTDDERVELSSGAWLQLGKWLEQNNV